MRTHHSLIASLLVAGAAALSLTGCSSDPAANEVAACDAYAGFAESVAAAKTTLANEPTVGEITEARDSVQGAYQQLGKSLESVAADRAKALEDAVASFNSAVEQIDTDMTVPEAVKSLAGEFQALEQADFGVDEALSCS
ncbi:hypothetical protein [Leucobacter sp. BZR 635]